MTPGVPVRHVSSVVGVSLVHHCVLGPGDGELRLALADELVAVAPRNGRRLDGLLGVAWRAVDLFLAGDRRAGRALAELRSGLDDHPCAALEFVVAGLDVTQAIRAGRLDEAEELARTCYHVGVAVGDHDAVGWLGAQLVCIRWFQGRGDELLALLEELTTSPTVAEGCNGFEAARAALAADAGAMAIAAAALAAITADGLAAVPDTSVWMAVMHGVAEAARALDDPVVAADVHALLSPHAGLPVMVSLGIACFGSAYRPLAVSAMTMGDVDLAIAHLEAALVADLTLGHRPAVALDRAELSIALATAGRSRRQVPGGRPGCAGERRRSGDGHDRSRRAVAAAAAGAAGAGEVVRGGRRAATVPHESVGRRGLHQRREPPSSSRLWGADWPDARRLPLRADSGAGRARGAARDSCGPTMRGCTSSAPSCCPAARSTRTVGSGHVTSSTSPPRARAARRRRGGDRRVERRRLTRFGPDPGCRCDHDPDRNGHLGCAHAWLRAHAGAGGAPRRGRAARTQRAGAERPGARGRRAAGRQHGARRARRLPARRPRPAGGARRRRRRRCSPRWWCSRRWPPPTPAGWRRPTDPASPPARSSPAPIAALAAEVAAACLDGSAHCAFTVVDPERRTPMLEWAPGWPALRWVWAMDGDTLRLLERRRPAGAGDRRWRSRRRAA